MWYTPAERNPFTGNRTMKIILRAPLRNQNEVRSPAEADIHQKKVVSLHTMIGGGEATIKIAKTPESHEMTIEGLVTKIEDEKGIESHPAEMKETKAIVMIEGIEIETGDETNEETEIEIETVVIQRTRVLKIDTEMKDQVITKKEIAQDRVRDLGIEVKQITDS